MARGPSLEVTSKDGKPVGHGFYGPVYSFDVRLVIPGESVTDPPPPRKGQRVKYEAFGANFWFTLVAKQDGWAGALKQGAASLRRRIPNAKVEVADDDGLKGLGSRRRCRCVCK